MERVEARVHEEWKQYLKRGGALNQASFIRFQERYPQILRNLETHESTQDACDAGSDSGLKEITAQFCAAFSTLRENYLNLRTTDASPIYWHSNDWLVRESLLLTNDQQASLPKEQTY
ncbi:MAG: hypothetical protein AABY16_03790 [Nanoarchaeota archaeon]